MKKLIPIRIGDKLAVGDTIVLTTHPEVRRVITECYEDGYEWHYESVPDKLFYSIGQPDAFFIWHWAKEYWAKEVEIEDDGK